MEADQLGRAPAPLAGNDLVSVRQAGNGPNDDRLHDPALADRCSQAAEVAFGKLLARISRIRAEKLDRHLAGAAAALDNLLFVSDIADQRREPPPEPRPRLFRHHGSLWRSSGCTQHALPLDDFGRESKIGL